MIIHWTPANTQRSNNVVTTSLQRQVVTTLLRRCMLAWFLICPFVDVFGKLWFMWFLLFSFLVFFSFFFFFFFAQNKTSEKASTLKENNFHLLYRERICSHRKQILSLWSSPLFRDESVIIEVLTFCASIPLTCVFRWKNLAVRAREWIITRTRWSGELMQQESIHSANRCWPVDSSDYWLF